MKKPKIVSDFGDTNRRVKKSWARSVEWELTCMTYTPERNGYYGRASSELYTLVVADMIDEGSLKLNMINFGFTDEDGFDNVEGYTIRQIEDALKGELTWDDWRENIINMHDNDTEGQLNLLFSAYE